MQSNGNITIFIAFLAIKLRDEVHLPRSLDELQPAEDGPWCGQFEQFADPDLFDLHLLFILDNAENILGQAAR